MKNNLKPYLVDVPVRVNIWIRPECQRKQFEVLKTARPSIMFLISDGGRNEKEWEAIRQNREIFENEIDWDCTVYKLYEEKNNGLYEMGRRGSELIWSKVDRCIFLEDDQIVSVSFFKYCAELLEKYKDDTRICGICSMNFRGVSENVTSDYFFCERGPVWGRATWKRVHEQRDYEFSYSKDLYIMKLFGSRIKNDQMAYKMLLGYAKDKMYGGHVPGSEFFDRVNAYAYNQLFIIPKYNMMSNIGCTADGAHATEYKLMPRAIRRIFNMKTYEYDCPLKHPTYMIADMNYKKFEEKVLGHNHHCIVFFRKIESLFLAIRYKGIDGILQRAKKKLKNRNKIET